MVRFLSREWVDALDRAVADAELGPRPGDAASALTMEIEHDVDGWRYHLEVNDGKVRFCPGPAPHATVRFCADRATAAAIARGTLSAQRAFMGGHLRVAGDVAALSRAQPVFAALDDVFAAVRAATDFGEDS